MPPFLKLGVDVDGILADFNTGYRALLKARTGHGCIGLADDQDPDCWSYPTKYGYTKQDENESWDEIKRSPDFWMRLPTYLETEPALQSLALLYTHGHEVTFITNRMGVHPHAQTVVWLMTNGYTNPPQVLVAEKKGPIVKALGLTHYIDDKPENTFDVKATSPSTITFMLKRRWNDHPEILMECEAVGVVVISSIKEMFDIIANEENAHAIVV